MARRPVAVGDVIFIKTYYTLEAQIAINDYAYKVAAFTGASLSVPQIIDLWSEAINDLLTPFLADPAVYYGMGGILTTGVKEKEVTTTVGGKVGHDAGELLPKQLSILIKKLTDTPGPSGGGRVYLPFFGEGDNDQGRPIPETLNAIKAFANVAFAQEIIIGTAPNTITVNPVLFNKAVPAASKPITGYKVVAKWATQRRRGDYGKTNAVPF